MSAAEREIDRTGINATTEALITDLVSADDAAWFESHPGRRMRERPAVEGEFHLPNGPADDVIHGIDRVLVVYIAPGVRTRVPMLSGDSRESALARVPPHLRGIIDMALARRAPPEEGS